MHRYRTHSCGELRAGDVGKTARLSGWVLRKRDHGHLQFVDLRDHYGITQCVIEAGHAAFAAVDGLRLESVATFTGRVVARSPETVNPNLPTGTVELAIEAAETQSLAEPLPLPVHAEQEYGEDVRLRYRYLDLRRERMHRNILLRSQIVSSLRRRMTEAGFIEFQTPILTASSPEGARDFLVPSRMHPGKFYALPQAPQQFKQLIMVSGFDRYFQIAPCFRDEDARADRSPGEFYQLDIEMAFVEQDDVFAAVEPVLHGLFSEFAAGRALGPMPFARIPYAEAMIKYGTDKPDLRNPIEICEASDLFAREEVAFKAFKAALAQGAAVRAIPAPGAGREPRSFFDKMIAFAQGLGAAGLAYIVFEDGAGKGPIAKFVPESVQAELRARARVSDGDALFFSCEKPALAARIAGEVRTELGRGLGLIERDAFRFCWIVDFPMYEYDEARKKIEFSHNPFSMPQGGLEALESKDPLEILAYQYDIVCNGIELSSGAIRNHRPDIMYKAFALAGYPPETVDAKFPALITAFKYGAPPHGGIAPGLDRIVMLLAEEPNIREVIAFPMNQQAQDLLMGAPAPAEPEHLRELHIRTVPPPRPVKD